MLPADVATTNSKRNDARGHVLPYGKIKVEKVARMPLGINRHGGQMIDTTSQQSQTVVQGEDSPRSSSPKRRDKTLQEHEAEARNGVGANASPPATKEATPPTSTSAPSIPRTFSSKTERDAAMVRELLVPGCLSAIIGKPDVLCDAGIKKAFDEVIADAGAPTDPVERMMIEQLQLCHHRLAILQAEASAAKTLEGVKIYNAAATRLMSEFRKSALALRDYRLGPSRKNVAFIRQQNVAAAGGSQTVEYQDQSNKDSFSRQSKLNKPEEGLHELRERVARGEHVAEPAAVAVDA